MKAEKKIYIVYVVFLLILSVVALEIGARIRYGQFYSLAANMRLDSVYHHLIPPRTRGRMFSEGDFSDSFIANNKGLRGPGDYEYAKKDNSLRIAVLGDSFTFGVGVKPVRYHRTIIFMSPTSFMIPKGK